MKRLTAPLWALLSSALFLLPAGCGRDAAPRPIAETAPVATQMPTPSATQGTPTNDPFRVWFHNGNALTAATRYAEAQPTSVIAVSALLAGPTREERSAGVGSQVPVGTILRDVHVRGGIATVDLSGRFDDGGGSLSMELRLAQVVYTLTEFPQVEAVVFELDGKPVSVFSAEEISIDRPLRRGDFAALVPGR